MVNDGDGESTARALRMRALLDRVADLAEEQTGLRANVAQPRAGSGVPALPGRVLPGELRDLYSVTAGAEAPTASRSVPPERLQDVNAEADEMLAEYAEMDVGELP